MDTQDLSSMFDADWNKAMSRYDASGYDESDSLELYLKPALAKRKIIETYPEKFLKPGMFKQISDDFDSATGSAIKDLTRDEPTGVTVTKRFAPLLQKWTVLASMPEISKTERRDLTALHSQMVKAQAMSTAAQKAILHLKPSDPDYAVMRANWEKQKNESDRQWQDWNAKYQEAVRGDVSSSAQSTVTPEVQTPFSRTGTSFVPPAEPSTATNESTEADVPIIAPYANAIMPARDAMQNAMGQGASYYPQNRGKFFISGEQGKPDLTNYAGGRTEADAAWQARYGRGVGFTTPAAAESESVEPTAKANEVIRLTKDGRQAVFDADTKEFLRYVE
jgi:hypothetical protein